MKLKHVLFSSLFLSAALVACTNDEFAEMQVPSVDKADAISLGEGFTVSGTKVSVNPDTRSFFEEGPNGINFNWEKDDILGAAWFSAIKEGGILPNGYVNTQGDYVGKANAAGKFAWNVDFNLDRFAGDDQGSAYFTANTNVSAGAYVMYSPWNEEISAEFSAIPVELEFPYTVNLAEGHEYDAVNENMFSYGVAAFVPGGRQTDKFSMQQVPVLYGLQLGIDNLKLVDLDNLQTIDRIVIEAYDKNGETVLTTAGQVAPPNEDVTARKYNEYIDFIADNTNDWSNNPLPKAVYSGKDDAKVKHYTIALENSNQAKYQISTLKDQLTDRIIFSSLPIMDEAAKLVVKVITDKGITLVKTFDPADRTATAEEKALAAETLASFNKAQNEGAMVTLKVRVDSQSDDNIIYTAGQFQEQWNAAIAADEAKTLVVADPVILKDITLECTNPQADVTIKLDDTEVEAALSLKAINVERGKVTIDCPVNVSGDIVSSANLDIKKEVTAKNIILNSNSNTMKVAGMEKLEVRESGRVTLVLPTPDYAAMNIGAIEVYRGGQLTVSEGYMNGPVKVYDGGDFRISGDVTNLNSFGGKATTAGTGKFINAKGATATLATGSSVVVENQEGGILYLNGGVKTGSVNAGEIFVQSGTLDVRFLTQKATGITTIEKGAKVTSNQANFAGWLVIKEMANIATSVNVGSSLAYQVESAEDFTAKTGVSNYFLKADVKMSGSWASGNLYIFTDQTIVGDVNVLNHVNICGNVKFSTVNPEKPVTYIQGGNSSLSVDGSLYLIEGVSIKTNDNAWIDADSYRFIDADDFKTQVSDNKPTVK